MRLSWSSWIPIIYLSFEQNTVQRCTDGTNSNFGGVGVRWGRFWLDFVRPTPTMRLLRRTTQLCRATCSYCPDVQRWTWLLEFLYCGHETVINLSWEGHLENGGWGVGGVFRNQKSSMRMLRGIADRNAWCSPQELVFCPFLVLLTPEEHDQNAHNKKPLAGLSC